MSSTAASSPDTSASSAHGEMPVQSGQVDRIQFIGWVAMVVGMFLAILDIQIVASSLENIQAGLSASPDEIGWVQTSYLIAEVVMIPLSGFLSRLMSTRWLFVISAIGFTVMSIASAFAWSIESMIWCRALQGFLGGAMIPTVFATTYIIFPPEKRNTASVMIGLIATMAPTVGPTLGGFLTQSLSWHWLFLINVIPGVLIATVVGMTLRIDKGDRSLLKGFDLKGLIAMAVFLGSLEYVLDEGPKDDWFDETAIVYGTIVCVIAGIYFFWRMFRYDKPIVDLKSFADRNFTMGCVFSFTLGIGLYGSVYIMPLMLGRIRGYDSLEIGIVMAVTGISQFLCAPIAGKMTAKYPPRVVLGIGLIMFAIGLAMHGFNTSEVSFNELIFPQIVRGAALMFCMLPVTNLALGTLPPEKIKNASGLYNLMRNLGGAMGMAGINTLLDKRIDYHFSHLAEHINPASTAFKQYLATIMARYSDMGIADPHAAAMKFIVNLVTREASMISFNDVYLAMAATFFIAFLLLPLARPARQTSAGGGGH
ncbi:DHA2 family efflux MFS transporter permease subunit [Thalassospira lucentensis]|uniref:DHA2 family efflux MFS transporter permease subunit n=1 Tax=Thalassospira lucentensis TaxID=168935 RepID=UPI0003B4E97F|nr:DHA2 family efflux MFS transporter permease subunit [Thalassospira lucentensis]RCK29367.1 MFS transporter [Thalassospira lucentensis MCCC 1A00383 = DSM 14000]